MFFGQFCQKRAFYITKIALSRSSLELDLSKMKWLPML